MSPKPPLLTAVRSMFGDPAASILQSDAEPLGDGFADAMAGGEGLVRHRGRARTSHGERPFDLVEKICRVLPMGQTPDSWLYWKREALAYGSGFLETLPAGISAPRCFGVAYTDTPTAHVFIEAVGDPQPQWTDAIYARASHALGRFTGGQAGTPDLERHGWMAPGRAHSWTAEAAPALDALSDLGSDPVLSVWLAGASFTRTVELWRNIDAFRNVLRDMPTCFCHHDAFRRNLLLRKDSPGGEEFIAIDWAFAGYGVPGEELAAMIGASLMFMEIEARSAPAWINLLIANYIAGLHASGWRGSETDIRVGVCITTAMTFALGAIGPWLPLLRDPGFTPIVEGIVGTDPDRFLRNLSEIQPVLLDLGEDALAIIAG